MLTHGIPPEFRGGVHIFLPAPHTIGSVPCLSGQAIAYRLRSLPRVRWHRASSPQCSSSNGCCLCITMDQMLLCSSLFPHPLLLIYSENVQIICKLSGVYKVYKYQNISTTAVLFVELFFVVSPRLEFSVHGTISPYVVFQNSYYCCTDCTPVFPLPTSVCTCVCVKV